MKISYEKIKKVGIVNYFSGYRYGCYKCGKSYKHQPTLSRHFKYECDGVRKFVCPICGKSYLQKYDAKKHIVRQHPSDIQRLCEI